ncbi:helix-turn-helix domain-containing protein [Embleya sp. NBC_00896]|uniref:helix-turn-helix domain-containing protein n=1 Tax=Embleya sp. NBC_00896 TaxID=2975961 RepID=UPI002F91653A|nr:helix-turn-helix domain-containing protein [Embleya sp. NBC_00896]
MDFTNNYPWPDNDDDADIESAFLDDPQDTVDPIDQFLIEPVLFTLDEAARLLRVRKGWLDRMARTGKAEYTEVDRSRRYSRANLNAIVLAHLRPADTP